MSNNQQDKQPQLGTYVTMIIGLLLMFLLVSQAGKYHESGFIVEKAKERVALQQERKKALLKIGATDTELTQGTEEQQRVALYNGLNENTAYQYNGVKINDTTTRQGQQNNNSEVARITSGQNCPDNINYTPENRRSAVVSELPRGILHNPADEQRSTESVPKNHYYRVRKDETLYRISAKIYGNGNLWRNILSANPQLTDPGNLRPGMKLVIPAPDSPNASFRRWAALNPTCEPNTN